MRAQGNLPDSIDLKDLLTLFKCLVDCNTDLSSCGDSMFRYVEICPTTFQLHAPPFGCITNIDYQRSEIQQNSRQVVWTLTGAGTTLLFQSLSNFITF